MRWAKSKGHPKPKVLGSRDVGPINFLWTPASGTDDNVFSNWCSYFHFKTSYFNETPRNPRNLIILEIWALLSSIYVANSLLKA